MVLSLGDRVRAAIAALMQLTGESQADLAVALGVSQAQVSRRQSGSAAWPLDDCDRVAAHYTDERAPRDPMRRSCSALTSAASCGVGPGRRPNAFFQPLDQAHR